MFVEWKQKQMSKWIKWEYEPKVKGQVILFLCQIPCSSTYVVNSIIVNWICYQNSREEKFRMPSLPQTLELLWKLRSNCESSALDTHLGIRLKSTGTLKENITQFISFAFEFLSFFLHWLFPWFCKHLLNGRQGHGGQIRISKRRYNKEKIHSDVLKC